MPGEHFVHDAEELMLHFPEYVPRDVLRGSVSYGPSVVARQRPYVRVESVGHALLGALRYLDLEFRLERKVLLCERQSAWHAHDARSSAALSINTGCLRFQLVVVHVLEQTRRVSAWPAANTGHRQQPETAQSRPSRECSRRATRPSGSCESTASRTSAAERAAHGPVPYLNAHNVLQQGLKRPHRVAGRPKRHERVAECLQERPHDAARSAR
jgi:hypothetical protein